MSGKNNNTNARKAGNNDNANSITDDEEKGKSCKTFLGCVICVLFAVFTIVSIIRVTFDKEERESGKDEQYRKI